jgi:multicomponent K+:H+ antiporter subunit D
MNHLLIAPILLPSLVAPFLVLALRRYPDRQRAVSILATLALFGISLALFVQAGDGVVRPYLLGAWPAPFGIVLVVDRLSATMVLLTSVLALAVVFYASKGWDERGRHFHPLFHFQLMGINGAFLTGDVFNLFVFFEVMLISSYGLLLHGGGARRLEAGIQYVAINLIGSTLFLFAVGVIYAVTGTLNMADLAAKAASVAPGDGALLRAGAILLFLVFAIKASLVPLHWWLPTAYSAAPAPAAALFAIMTKVGAYCIIRIYTLIFGVDGGAAASIAVPWIVPAALATLVIGAIGVLGARSLVDLVCFAVVWSMGSLLAALGLFDVKGITAALYYTLHSTLIAGGLFLVVDLIGARRGACGDRLVPCPPMAQASLVGGVFFLAAIAMAGLPPLSGFVGKIMILDATRGQDAAVWIWSILLISSLVVIIGFSRAGTTLFWKAEAVSNAPVIDEPGIERRGGPIAAAAVLVLATGLLAVFAGPVTARLEATALQVLDREAYVRAVLGPDKVAAVREVRP